MSTRTTISLHGKPVQVSLTRRALSHLRHTGQPVVAEIELYFSCLIRKRVLFRVGAPVDDAVPVNEYLSACFRPVTTAHCRISDAGEDVPTVCMPVREPGRFVPHTLTIDFRGGALRGDFSYGTPSARTSVLSAGVSHS